MKKLIALMLALLMSFTMLVACNDDEESSSQEQSESTPSGLPEENTEYDNVLDFAS